MIRPAHAIDWVSLLPSHAIVNTGATPPTAKSSVNPVAPPNPDEKAHASSPEVAETSQEQLAERVGEYSERGDGAHPYDGIGVAQTMLAQIIDDEWRADGQVGSTKVQSCVSAKQQRNDQSLPGAQPEGA